MYFQKTRLWFWAATILALVLFCGAMAHAQLPTDVEETSISVGYSDIANDIGIDILVAVPYEFAGFNGYSTAISQRTDNVNRTKYHLEVGRKLTEWLEVNVYFNGLRKQYVGSEAGSTRGVGMEGEFSAFQVGDFEVAVSFGVEGQNGGQIGRPSAGDILEANKFNPTRLEELGLYGLIQDPQGLTLQQGNAFKGAIGGSVTHKNGFTLGFKALPDVVSESEYKAHQLIVSMSTSLEFGESLSLDIGGELGIQTSPVEANTIEHERAIFIGGKYAFKGI